MLRGPPARYCDLVRGHGLSTCARPSESGLRLGLTPPDGQGEQVSTRSWAVVSRLLDGQGPVPERLESVESFNRHHCRDSTNGARRTRTPRPPGCDPARPAPRSALKGLDSRE